MSFSKDGYEVVQNVISQQLLQNLKIEFEMLKDTKFFILDQKDKYAFNTLNNSCLDYLWFEETQQLFKNKKSATLGYS
jgi:hypothetical protein